MSAATQPLNLTDFTGGLNLRASEFNLADNESPDLMNVEIDPRGGIHSRKGWDKWSSAAIATPWNPRAAFVHELASGLDIVLVANGARLYRSTNGTFTKLKTAVSVDVVCGASPHLADFAPWGDTAYIVCGKNNNSVKLVANSTYAVGLTASGAANWNNDILAPTTGNMPRAECIATHAGFTWVANTVEDGNPYPHRVRWSHPNQPEAWQEGDFEDILEGGGPITAIMPFEDHLLVFKQSSIWAIYGYDADSRQIINVSRSLGAFNRQVVVQNENAVFFLSWPNGVYALTGGKVAEVSASLRPAFSSTKWNEAANNNMWLGWLGQRLWFAAPYHETDVVTDATSVFVLDPSIGAWTMFRGSDGGGLGPFAQGGFGQGSYELYGCRRKTADVMRVDALQVATDESSAGVAAPFLSSYTTKWLHAGWPERKKRWRRPTFIARLGSTDYRLKCSIYANFEETDAKRRFDVIVGDADDGVVYDGGTLYDNGAFYGVGVEGSTLRKGGSVGSASAVQLQIDGEPGKAWGVDGVVMKYRMRG